MVVFIDLESEDDDAYSHSSPYQRSLLQHTRRLSRVTSHEDLKEDGNILHPEENADTNGQLFASALACYPVSLAIAAHLDLNDLYSLSFTCRRVHGGLSQFARQLRMQSLHCINDVPPRTSEEEVDAIIFREALGDTAEYSIPDTAGAAFPVLYHTDASQLHVSLNSALGLSGKVSKCARDMVAPCRKCGTIVCRNCTAKPPSDRCLPNRFRRLCRTCLDAPLSDHLHPLYDDHDSHDTPPASIASSASSVRSFSSATLNSDSTSVTSSDQGPPFTTSSFLRQPCSCVDRGVYLCQPCGSGLNAADTTYKRVWTWRSRYSTHIGGGIGTGLGLGNQGQKCGRGEHCLERGAAGVCWVEIDCSETRARNNHQDNGLGMVRSSTPLGVEHEADSTPVNRPGYLSQELEGIGGVLKKKVKKRVKVGATVYEFDDERANGKYLMRESSGKLRSWCGWCSRVCPGEQDMADIDRIFNAHG